LALLLPATLLPAQNSSPNPAQPAAKAKRQPPKPQATAAPGGGADKVWVNLGTSVYHCPGDRYYGKTKDGQYMTEKQAKAAGAHGARKQTCFQ
jgi:hypothetical protein